MKTHPTIAALRKAGVTDGQRAIEGYLEVDGGGTVRVHSSLEGGVAWEVDFGRYRPRRGSTEYRW